MTHTTFTRLTNFETKDALPSGSALKRVKGVEIEEELEQIELAVNAKADLNSPALSGTPTAPTATAGTSTTQVATTAFTTTAIANIPAPSAITAAEVNALAYPVGSIYTSISSTNPSTLLGVGTWVAFGSGKVLLGVQSATHDSTATGEDVDFNAVRATGGAKTHPLTEDEMPVHDHASNLRVESNSVVVDSSKLYQVTSGYELDQINSYSTVSTYTGDAGSGDAHNNLQPYITVYFWERTV